jgi:hypothetical protein
MRQVVKQDISAFGPAVQFRYQRDLEPPDPAEGFSRIEIQAFARARDAGVHQSRRDRVVRRRPHSRPRTFGVRPQLVRRTRRRASPLRRRGWLVLGIGWQPDIAEKNVTAAQADAHYAKMQERLGVAIDVLYCPHGGARRSAGAGSRCRGSASS